MSDGLPELSVVVPTYCERANVRPLWRAIAEALDGVSWELIVVDDASPDGTADTVDALGDPRVRCLRRAGPRGLAPSVRDGLLAARGAWVAVMDADLQHDPAMLPTMLAALREGQGDLAVASRFVPGGATPGLGILRRGASLFAIAVVGQLGGVRCRDPLSGCFLGATPALRAASEGVRAQGFKILVDLLLLADPPFRVVELPTVLRPRTAGESKLRSREAADLLRTLIRHRLRARTRGRTWN